jgi:hypothetical protein
MSTLDRIPFEATLRVRDTCLCLHLQRAARAVARRFDAALRPLGLTNGQFSLLMSLNHPVTAALKPLERRGLLTVSVDGADKRSRRLTLTPAGRALLVAALPVWENEHTAINALLAEADPDRLRADLRTLR